MSLEAEQDFTLILQFYFIIYSIKNIYWIIRALQVKLLSICL